MCIPILTNLIQYPFNEKFAGINCSPLPVAICGKQSIKKAQSLPSVAAYSFNFELLIPN